MMARQRRYNNSRPNDGFFIWIFPKEYITSLKFRAEYTTSVSYSGPFGACTHPAVDGSSDLCCERCLLARWSLACCALRAML